MRIESAFHPHLPDGRSAASFSKLRVLLPEIAECRVLDVYCVDDRLEPDWITDLVCDPVAQAAHVGVAARSSIAPGWTHVIEVAPRPGVTDPVARTLESALRRISEHELPDDLIPCKTAVQYVIRAPGATMSSISACSRALYNPLIQICEIRARGDAMPLPEMYPHVEKMPVPAVQTITLEGLSLEGLMKLSTDRLLALEAEEMQAIQAYYARADVQADRRGHGLAEATDVEIEMLAQTWSEHCKHKIFAAEISYKGETIDGLFRTYVAAVTKELMATRTDTVSVFDDNSGVVEFDEDTLVCLKAETHNSPSALDPYGGAITGIVGVNRDILGTGLGARPIFNTNVLCFGDPETASDEVPGMLLHPRRVLEGVHHGIVDGGNQSGIPVVAGAVLFDESYMGKPLVFCGTGGVMPRVSAGRRSWEKAARPGDHAVMVGGRIGKDGIHGATFSSLALDETSPTSAVQIGDPITQKKMVEFLLQARDAGYLSSLTDNGAGGLSSSLGEMARESGGVSVNLDLCPLKYPGLAAWEIWVSESQERMSAAVPPEHLDSFLALAERHDVEATAIGRFTDSGYIELEHCGNPVCRLEMNFIHDGLPRMRLAATWIPPEQRGPWRLGEPVLQISGKNHRVDAGGPAAVSGTAAAVTPPPAAAPQPADHGLVLLQMLSDSAVGSREHLVRQYDHEVQARTVGKPFAGVEADGPSDGGIVFVRHGSRRALTVTHGVCPRYGDWDGYHMGAAAVDEAVRAHVALGGDPQQAWALDNFCWPDPVQSERSPDGEYKLAQLVRTCTGMADACRAYGTPLISGKDSMKNDARANGRVISIRPTLLVSLMGIVPDVSKRLDPVFDSAGDRVYLLGLTRGELGGTTWDRLYGPVWEASPVPHFSENAALYREVHAAAKEGLMRSVHDLSDGGLGIALAESAIAGRRGVHVDLSQIPADESVSTERLLWSESCGRFLVSVAPGNSAAFEARMDSVACARIGEVSAGSRIVVEYGGDPVLDVELEACVHAWHRFDRLMSGEENGS